jgi:P27 family predicted phage terminase small subunit
MGERGPAPKPTAIRELEGNPSHRPLPKNEPKPDKGAACPEWLPDEAKVEWQRVAPELERLGLLTKVDSTALAAYCAAYARWRAAEEAIATNGLTFETAGGYAAQRPEVGIANKAMADIRAFCKEFGLTPSARGRMSVPGEDKPTDPMAKLLGEPPTLSVVQ